MNVSLSKWRACLIHLAIFGGIITLVLSFHVVWKPNIPQTPLNSHKTLSPIWTPKNRWWHLDLKGAPPKIQFLEKWIELASKAGATGVLVEWEDMFPYSGALQGISASNCFSKQEVKRLQIAAVANGLQIVSLVQSVGHLEFLLKLEKWSYLRENRDMPTDACPSNTKTADIVLLMIQQVLELVPSTFIHIGGDEVRYLGHCPVCRSRGLSPSGLLIEYFLDIAERVKKIGNMTVLLWDDMLRDAPQKMLVKLSKQVQPVIWAYSEDVVDIIPKTLLHKYARIFPKLWVASAFKGASEPTAILPNVLLHASNSFSWMKTIRSFPAGSQLKFVGFISTGWSRFDHFAALCELFPTSVPTLILSLLISGGETRINVALRELTDLLTCPSDISFDAAPIKVLDLAARCNFTGSDFLSFSLRYSRFKISYRNFESKWKTSAYTSPYNLRRNFTSPIWASMMDATVSRLLKDVTSLRKEAVEILEKYFSEATRDEWIEQHFSIPEKVIKNWKNRTKILSRMKEWPKRPLKQIES